MKIAGFWSVPRMWAGRTVAILASGPSMSEAVAEAVRNAGVPTISVNTTHRLAPWADMLYAADETWWNHPDNRDATAFAGLKVSVASVRGVLRLRNSGVTGFDADPQSLRTGGNGGYQALHIAVHAGASRVLLCGYDMRGCHWHGKHPRPLRRTEPEVYAQWCKRYETLLPALAKQGVDVVNVTPGSALSCFRRAVLEDELAARDQLAA